MSFTGLPTELLCDIIRYLMPDDYESLMLSCKRLYEAGSDLLPRHNKLRRRYRHFEYDNEIQNSAQLLYCIAKEPIIADYIETADFFDDGSLLDFPGYDLEEWMLLLGRYFAVDTIQAILTHSKLLTHVNLNATKWTQVISQSGWKSELPIFATTIVLSLLSNVRQLVLPKQWCEFSPAHGNTIDDEQSTRWKAIEGVLKESLDEKRHRCPLSRLTRIRPYPLNQAMNTWALQVLSPFLAVPSLREFAAVNCIAHRAIYAGRPFKWRYPSQICAVEKIELAFCCVDGELANLLKHTPHLRSFKLSYETKRWGCGDSWDVYSLIEALRNHCAGTLEKLALTIDSVADAIKGGLVSLRDFSALKHLELDVRIFFGPPPVTKALQEMAPREYRNYAYDSIHWNGTAVPCLADILPPSIKSVRLIAGFCREDILIMKSLLSRLGSRVSNNLPHLERLLVSRATSRIGVQSISTGQSEVAWKSVADLVQSEGPYTFENVEKATASWHKSFYEES